MFSNEVFNQLSRSEVSFHDSTSYEEIEAAANTILVTLESWLQQVPDDKHTRPVREKMYEAQVSIAGSLSQIIALWESPEHWAHIDEATDIFEMNIKDKFHLLECNVGPLVKSYTPPKKKSKVTMDDGNVVVDDVGASLEMAPEIDDDVVDDVGASLEMAPEIDDTVVDDVGASLEVALDVDDVEQS